MNIFSIRERERAFHKKKAFLPPRVIFNNNCSVPVYAVGGDE